MARIENNQGHYLELEPVAYQFETAEDLDGLNWLEIRIDASDGKDKWAATNPVLQTWEVMRLIEWLRRLVAKDEAAKPVWQSLEPRLKVERIHEGNETKFMVSLAYKFLRLAPRDGSSFARRIEMTFAGDGANVLKFADELEQELRRFPIRRP